MLCATLKSLPLLSNPSPSRKNASAHRKSARLHKDSTLLQIQGTTRGRTVVSPDEPRSIGEYREQHRSRPVMRCDGGARSKEAAGGGGAVGGRASEGGGAVGGPVLSPAMSLMSPSMLGTQLINPEVEIKMVENTPDDPRQRKPDITKAKELLGWEPKVKLRDGLPLMENDFRTRLGIAKKI